MRTRAPILRSLRRIVPQVAFEPCLSQSDAPQGAEQDVGHRSKPQAQLIGVHRRCRGAVGIEIELTLLDPVLHVTACAVDFFVEVSCLALRSLERGDDKPRIGFVFVHSALATTRRSQLQLLRVLHLKSLKRRAGLPVRRLSASARSSSSLISAMSRSFFAKPKIKSTSLASHQAISSSRAKPLSARSRIRTFGHRLRICATMRATSSTAPAAASRFARRSLAASRWRPQKI